VKTAHGVEVARHNTGNLVSWNRNLWTYSSSNSHSTRYLIRTGGIPAGEMHFGFFAIAQPSGTVAVSPATSPPLKPRRLSGKWKVDRTQIKTLNLAAMPRKPWVKVRSVTITQVIPGNKRGGVPNKITGEVVFDLQSGAMNEKTPFQESFSEHDVASTNRVSYGMGWSSSSSVGMGTPETPRTRVRYWEVSQDSPTVTLNVSGRVSADNRWPLGFEIEPFSFKSAKVGQKLRFKQGPVALPKG
jgi:hypothetical protein